MFHQFLRLVNYNSIHNTISIYRIHLSDHETLIFFMMVCFTVLRINDSNSSLAEYTAGGAWRGTKHQRHEIGLTQ